MESVWIGFENSVQPLRSPPYAAMLRAQQQRCGRPFVCARQCVRAEHAGSQNVLWLARTR